MRLACISFVSLSDLFNLVGGFTSKLAMKFILVYINICVSMVYISVKCSKIMSIHYLMLFAQEKLKCAVPELESIGRIFGINLAEKWAKNQVDSSSMRLLGSINEQDVKNVMSRSVLTKSAFEIWGVGRNLSELKVSIFAFPDTFKLKHFDESKTFAVRVKGIGKKVSLSEQVSKMDALEDVLPFHGKVNLTCPDAEFYIIEDYLDRVDGQSPAIPSAMYFGRLVCHGQRSLIDRYSLKKRKFIGNTSMDPTLAMVMANLACSTHGHLTCDPFVGTGSLLVAAAHFGSHVIGGDINYNILHAQGKSSRKGAGEQIHHEKWFESFPRLYFFIVEQ